MTPDRELVYEKIGRSIGQTPLYELKNIDIPNGNRIFAKEEYLNPTGSHYDRVFWRLLFSLEREEKICPCQELVETTSGNAGASFAWLSAALGYKATVIIPEDMPNARLAQIRSFGAKVVFSPPGEYVSGAIGYLKKYLKERKRSGQPVYCTNHAEAEASSSSVKEAGDEIINQLRSIGVDQLDAYISALGGGITLRGISESLQIRWPEMKIVGVEPVEAPEYSARKYPDRFETSRGSSVPRKPHCLLGIGRWGDDSYKFPHMEKMLSSIDDILLVTKTEWLEMSMRLRDVEGKHVGRTSAASLWAALQLAENLENKNLVILFFDPAWKYLNLH